MSDPKPPNSGQTETSHSSDASPQSVSQKAAASPWAPLTIPAYRTFWIAGLISNMGTWMHETGAVWLMTALEPRPEMVSAVRTCMTIPVFCLALPAGVWADHFDRRSWLIATQSLLLAIAAAMTALAAMQLLTPVWLLVLTATMGVAMVLNQPAWQALTPELVPPALIPSAVSVGSMSFNLARALGPFVAGLLIAQWDVWVTFGFNAFSFLAIVAVLIAWKPEVEVKKKRKSKPKFFDELRKGMFVIQNSPPIKNTLIRVFVFAIPASILWSLLSLVATEKLGYQERGFGFCLGLIGAGAVSGAWFIPYARQKLSSDSIVLGMQILYAGLCIVIGMTNSSMWIIPSLFVIGMCWMASMTTFNATAQVHLPRKFRARGMAAFLMAFALGMAIGSATWGWLAFGIGVGPAFIVAGIVKIGLSLWMNNFKLGSLSAQAVAG